MKYLRANTEVIVTIGPAVDSTNGVTPETGVTLSAADQAEILKHGSTTVVDISGATWAAITNCAGNYSLTLTTAYLDTEGMLDVIIQDESVCLPLKGEYMVLSEAAYDSLYAAKDAGFMDINIKTIGRVDTQETEANNLESACSNYSATRGLTGTAVPAVAADGVGGLPISDAGGLDLDAMNTAAVRLTAARAQVLDDWINAGRLDLLLDAIPTTAMRGTDNGALASVVGALDNAAADGDPTTADTLMQYLKQLVNVLVGTSGIVAFPAEAAPANAVSLAEVIRAIHADVTGLNGSAMIGTNSAALASVCTEGRLGELDAANLPTDLADIPTVAEFEARTIAAADYLIASDTLATVTAITNDVGITQAGADKAWSTAVRALTDKAGFALSSAGIDAIFDQNSSLSISFENLINRTYEMVSNKMTVNETSGDVALRDIGDSNDIATGNVASSSGTTTRAELSWI